MYNNNYTFFQWNARSIWTNLLAFENHISENNYAVIALQSLNVEKRRMPKLEGYYYPPICNCYENSVKVKVALYIRQDLKYTLLSDVIPKDLNDIFWIGAKVKIDNTQIINFVSIYLPSGPNNSNTDWLKDPKFKKDTWCILGDFNAHDPSWEDNCFRSTSSRLVENITDSNLITMNNGDFTRIPDVATHRPSAIDLSLLSPDLAISSSWKILDDCLGSDHLPITLTLNKKDLNHCESEQKIPKFKYHLARWDLFRQHLEQVNLEEVQDPDIDKFYSNFTSKIIEAAKLSIPVVKPKTCKKAGNVWWTDDCKQAVDNKRKYFKIWKKNKTQENFVNMKRFKCICNRIIAKAKKTYWIDFCENEISDSTDVIKVWRKTKQMKHKNNTQVYPVKIEGNDFPSSNDKAKAFNDFFSKNSLSVNLENSYYDYRKKEEEKPEYADPTPDNTHYLNSDITYSEFENALNHFSNNETAVGFDGVSYRLLSNLPKTFKQVLFTFFQNCWVNETLPTHWKSSVIVPVPKDGKPRCQVNSYRPIALTSHICKLFEEIILIRLSHHCEKNNIIPCNQSGFRKGRSTNDHLVRLTNHIKRQFSRRKSVLATFFDVKKAYDSVWHRRLLFKLKNIGVSGHMYHYIKNLITNRKICTKVDNVFSCYNNIDQGIPQGSLIAPLLFSILIYDLPESLSKTTKVAQYADDIAIWLDCNLRKKTKKRVVSYIEKIYQREINAIQKYMFINGLQLSSEKTVLMVFNNGQNCKILPNLKIGDQTLEYKDSVKFLGVHFTTNLSWKVHINDLLAKARKNLNLLKIICNQPWGQDTKTLIHLANALVRSRLVYGQECFFAAPKCLLKKIQSLDGKAFKLALGVPISSNTLKSYSEAGVLPINELRRLAASKYIVRYLSLPNNDFKEEILLTSKCFPKRAKNIPYLKTIFDFTEDLFLECDIEISNIKESPLVPVLPPWEHLTASFDIDYESITKKENPNILINNVRIHLSQRYDYYLKIYTDGSVLQDKNSGAGFVIPALDIQRSFHLGKGFSIFTCELFAILNALILLRDTNLSIFNVLFCVDSKSVLYSLQNWESKTRNDIILEIRYLIHILRLSGLGISFTWVPSHLGLYWNGIADSMAKKGAQNEGVYKSCNFYDLSLDQFELKSKLNLLFKEKMKIKPYKRIFCPRYIACLIHKFRMNSWKTKYSKDITCVCKEPLSIHHILMECHYFKDKGINNTSTSMNEILLDDIKLLESVKIIAKTEVGNLL